MFNFLGKIKRLTLLNYYILSDDSIYYCLGIRNTHHENIYQITNHSLLKIIY
jgi:hypothetical protein